MKLKSLFVLPLLLMMTGCGIAQTNTASKPKPQAPDIKKIVLSYIPPNEPVAPHDVEWLVDHAVNDGGYYGTGHIPGTITVVKKHMENVDLASGQRLYPFGQSVYQFDWNVDNMDFQFWVFKEQVWDVTKSDKPYPAKAYDVITESNWALYALESASSN